MIPQALFNRRCAVLRAAQAEHLRRTRLAGRLIGGAGKGLTRGSNRGHVDQCALDHLQIFLAQRNLVRRFRNGELALPGAGVFQRAHQVRFHVNAVVGQNRGGLGKLHQRKCVIALTNRH